MEWPILPSCLFQEYLHHFYGDKSKPVRPKRAAGSGAGSDRTTGLCKKIKDMQRFFGLPPSGELTQETMATMRRPRCGLSDAEPFGETIRWKKRNLSYRLECILSHCLARQQLASHQPTPQQGFGSKPCPLKHCSIPGSSLLFCELPQGRGLQQHHLGSKAKQNLQRGVEALVQRCAD